VSTYYKAALTYTQGALTLGAIESVLLMLPVQNFVNFLAIVVWLNWLLAGHALFLVLVVLVKAPFAKHFVALYALNGLNGKF
jgi:hypothetical protein